jgi:hypothetical protein
LLLRDCTEYLRVHATEEDVSNFLNVREDLTAQIRGFLEAQTQSLSLTEEFEEFKKEEPTEEIPQTFAVWSSERPSQALSAVDRFRLDVEEYESYLGQGFHARYLLEFRDTIARIRQHEVENFTYTPTTGMSLHDFMLDAQAVEADPVFSISESSWDLHLLRCYEAYLSTPEHIAHFRHARNSWAESDYRELQGLDRDPFSENLRAMQNDVTHVQDAIAHARTLIEGSGRYMTLEQRERLRDSIADLERVESFMRAHIELRAFPTEFQREDIGLTIYEARETWRESVRAVTAPLNAGDNTH